MLLHGGRRLQPLGSLCQRFALATRRSASSQAITSQQLQSQLTKPARTRFAPSPTGYLHLGSLRTALFNYLIARKTGGRFLLRIEDTDQKRTVPDAEKRLCEDLHWAGLNWDEGPGVRSSYGPFRQSERTNLYQSHAQKLVTSGHAYRCFCTAERLDDLARRRKQLGLATDYDRQCAGISKEESDNRAADGEAHVIRLLSPNLYPKFIDLVYGKVGKDKGGHAGVTVKHGEIAYEDPILLKTDGRPTYHLANVVDDHLMEITHVVRATEWMSSTPKHLALYQAFGWEPPQFAHVGLLVNEEGQKLSKRHLHTDIQHYKDAGYLRSALVNFVALLGWSHGRRSDVMDLAELVDEFTMKFTRGNAVVKLDKLNYLQRNHAVRAIKSDKLLDEMVDRVFSVVNAETGLKAAPGGEPLEPYIRELIESDAQNYTTPEVFYKRNVHFFTEPQLLEIYDHTTDARLFSTEELHNVAVSAFQKATANDWAAEPLNNALKAASSRDNFSQEEQKAAYRALCKYLRWFLLDGNVGPSIAHAMAILGKEVCAQRIAFAARTQGF